MVIAALHGRVEAASDAMAVSTARGVVPQARARVLGTRTDSERLVVPREGAKGAFQCYVGTCRRIAPMGRDTQNRASLSVRGAGMALVATRARCEAALTATPDARSKRRGRACLGAAR